MARKKKLEFNQLHNKIAANAFGVQADAVKLNHSKGEPDLATRGSLDLAHHTKACRLL
uniref:Uncharacterized protein n=1 Tax=Kalanchoe fedtschenkoi TaxID=63787 RepID=A0A7N0UKF3_KALFE